MKHSTVTYGSSNVETVPEVFSPKGSYLRGHNETHVESEPRIQLFLEHDKGVFLKIREIKLTASLYNGRVLLHEEPPHMCEEESTSSIMRVCVSLRVFVVDAVITCPVEN